MSDSETPETDFLLVAIADRQDAVVLLSQHARQLEKERRQARVALIVAMAQRDEAQKRLAEEVEKAFEEGWHCGNVPENPDAVSYGGRWNNSRARRVATGEEVNE